MAWLQTYLADFKGTVLAITHDRYFLEDTCKWILELERGEGKPYEGNYSGWLAKKAELMKQAKKKDDALQKTLENELEWVRSNAKAKQTKSKARLSRYEELLNTPAREALAHSATIYVPPGPRLGQKVIEAQNVRKGFGDRVLISDLSFSLPPGGIVGVIGPNGAVSHAGRMLRAAWDATRLRSLILILEKSAVSTPARSLSLALSLSRSLALSRSLSLNASPHRTSPHVLLVRPVRPPPAARLKPPLPSRVLRARRP